MTLVTLGKSMRTGVALGSIAQSTILVTTRFQKHLKGGLLAVLLWSEFAFTMKSMLTAMSRISDWSKSVVRSVMAVVSLRSKNE